MAQSRCYSSNNNRINGIFYMNRSKQFQITTALLGMVLLAIVGVLSFYIVHNAQWLVGDDAIVINHTGWGIPFSIWDTIKPEIGRFFPLTYMHENLILLLPGDTHSATQHYILNMLLFIGLVGILLKLMWIVIKPSCVIDLLLLFFSLILCICRTYITYLNVFSTMYYYITHTALFILCLVLYYERKHIVYAIFALLLCSYMVFCGEVIFLIPFSLGLLTLIFAIKRLTTQQIGFNIGLICVAIGFLMIYFFGIYLKSNTDSFYDPSHGTGVTFFENAIAILKGQKFILFAALVWIVRQIILLCKKDQYHVLYDSLLWTSGAILLGGLILKLDWQLYYYVAILYALPSVVYLGYKYFGKMPTLIVIILFAGLHALKVPNAIKLNQSNRVNTVQVIEYLSKQIDNGKEVVWYETVANDSTSFDLILRNWQKDCMRTYLQFYLKDNTWDYVEYSQDKAAILLYPILNDTFANRSIELPNQPVGMINDILIYQISTTFIKE